MYIEEIIIENYGPIENLNVQMPFKEDGDPIPVILVGKNGSGKTILLSHIINSLIAFKGIYYENSEVEKGKVYKLRSPKYIRTGKFHSFLSIKYQNNVYLNEWVLACTKADFEEKAEYVPNVSTSLNKIPNEEFSLFDLNPPQINEHTKKLVQKQCCLYFPVNRDEDPNWLNNLNLKSIPKVTNKLRTEGVSNRTIIAKSPLRENRDWIMDLILDRELYGKNTVETFNPLTGQKQLILLGYKGVAAKVLQTIGELLNKILKYDFPIRIGIGNREGRSIALMNSVTDEQIIPDLFNLSTGEVLLINLALTIMRDVDQSFSSFEELNNYKGIVLIDEIDVHLHTVMQYEVLPELIGLFPKIQFIITTHSPFFLLGAERKFGADGVCILDLPKGEKINASMFNEFLEAYKTLKETKKFQDEIRSAQKPRLYLEGITDLEYIMKAAKLYKKEDLVSQFELIDGRGEGSLKKKFKGLEKLENDDLNQKILFLFDCEVKITEMDKGSLFKRKIPFLKDNPIKKGIENLFSKRTITKIRKANSKFIDVDVLSKIVRGNEQKKVTILSVNEDEKTNLCKFMEQNGTKADFKNFEVIFKIIEEIIVK